jgi:hypothetical protein
MSARWLKTSTVAGAALSAAKLTRASLVAGAVDSPAAGARR